MEQIRLTCPPAVRRLIDLFAACGEAAYPVGGCVRDALMGVPPHDWDVAVTTVPAQTQAICEAAGFRVIPTGMAHGTVTVLVPTEEGGRMSIECTTCRTEGGYADGRHPDAVAFTGLIEDDLSRRDFTVNALAATVCADDENTFGIIDLFGGQEDLAKGIVRCVGDPLVRLREDALRILRAVRFAVKLGFDIEPETKRALVDCAEGLRRISRERIREEFEKILCSPDPERGVACLRELGLMPYVLPSGVSPDGMGDLSSLPMDFAVRMACLTRGMNPEVAQENLRGLRLPNEVVARVRILQETPIPTDVTPRVARDLRRACGEEAIPLLLIGRARGVDTEGLIELVRASMNAGDCVSIADLVVDGRDLMALGVPAGRAVGRLLSELLEIVMEDPQKNDRKILIEEAKKRI